MEEKRMMHLHTLSSHGALRNPRLCFHHSLSSQDSIRTGGFSSTISRLSSTRTSTKKPYLKCRRSEYFDQQKFVSRPTSGSSFGSQSPDGGGGGYFWVVVVAVFFLNFFCSSLFRFSLFLWLRRKGRKRKEKNM